jgi:RNA polymerase sigma-70 factor (ECF subfamily)
MTDWTAIVQQHGPLIWRTVYRLLGNEADAADSFQRTLVSAFTLSQREPIGNWPALLRSLAIARALECLRQRQRDASRLTHYVDACVDRRNPVPDRAAEAAELAEHLRYALAELDARQAQVFCLACLEDQSYQQIADEFGITVNHVGVLLNRARANLRQLLQAHEPAPAPEDHEPEVQP